MLPEMRSVVDGLCSHARRGACTDAERRAAAWLHDELRSRGHAAWVETRWLRPQRWTVLALGCGLAVAGSLLSAAVPVAGLAVAGLALASLAVEAAGRVGPLRVLFPRRATQHVLTAPPDEGPVLVVTASYDAPRRGLILSDRWRRLRVPGALAACAAIVVAAAAARVGGAEGVWLGAVQLVPTLVLLLALAAAADVASSDWAAGASDCASGVAVALALFDALVRDPPPGPAPALLLTGAGHADPRVLAAHLRRERLRRDRVRVLELGPCGAGEPSSRPTRRGVRIAGLEAEQVDDAALERALALALGVVR